jgi:hypothetical protein
MKSIISHTHRSMEEARHSKSQAGFFKLIILIVVALLLLRYFGLTITGVLDYLGLSVPQILGWLKDAWIWFKDLFNSVK